MGEMTLAKNWFSLLSEEMQKPYVQDLKRKIEEDKKRGAIVYPPSEEVFRAFASTPFSETKVVIMGQDPYHGEGQAHGLCFSVRRGVKPPPSLKNVFQELSSDVGVPMPNHGCLESWSSQGVLLLNATLTVRAKEPRSHYGWGWEQFTDAVVEKLCEREKPLVFLLWGKSAFEKCTRILETRKHPHAVFTAAHPSPYSVRGFIGCRHFSKANAALESWGQEPVDWRIV